MWRSSLGKEGMAADALSAGYKLTPDRRRRYLRVWAEIESKWLDGGDSAKSPKRSVTARMITLSRMLEKV